MNKYFILLKFSLKIFYRNKLHILLMLMCLVVSTSFSYILLRKAYHDNYINKNYLKYKNTYRLITYYKSYDKHQADFNSKFLDKIKSQIPEIKNGARVKLDYPLITKDLKQENGRCKNFFLMDNDAFAIFNMININGDKLRPLKKGKILLSERNSKELFNTSNVIGKTISIMQADQEYEFVVAGVFQNYPEQSTLDPAYVINFNSFYTKEQEEKIKAQMFLTIETGSIKNIITKINELNPYPDDISFDLQPIDEIYFHSSHITNDFMHNKGNLLFHKLGILISIILLFFGLINFTSLCLSFYTHRIKELYIRKVNGSISKDFNVLFFLELFVIFITTIIISYALIYGIRCLFNIKILNETYLSFNHNIALAGIVLCVVCTFISLSILVIRKGFLNRYLFGYWDYIKYKGSRRLNKIFNLFQLSIVILLFLFITIITKQLSYSNSNLKGYEHSNLYKVNFPMYNGESKYDLLKEKLLQFPEMKCVAGALSVPMAHGCYYVNLTSKIDSKDVPFELLCVDKDFFEVLQARFISDFDLQTLNNFSNTDIIINQSGAEILGLKNYSNEIVNDYKIRAVINDINYETSITKVPARIYMINTDAISNILIKYIGNDSKRFRDIIFKRYNNIFPDFDVDIQSYDDLIKRAYKDDIELKNILIFVVLLMFLLTTFGFFSIASYDFIKNAKTIAIRRILGGKISTIVIRNVKETFLLFVISSVFSFISGYYLSEIWLANYYYRITINYSYFVGAIMVGLVVIILNVLIFIRKTIKLDACKVLKDD